MSIWKKIRRLLRKPKEPSPVELVTTYDEDRLEPHNTNSHVVEMLNEVDFSQQGDLKAYVRSLTIPKEAIEGWISAGLLNPEETKTAEKMIKILIEDQKKYGQF
jgi:hypothetical protein